MNKDRWKKLMYGLVAALLLSACSQDELAENSTALPEGEYPLQIGSVTLTVEVSEQPWTRVSENLTDGMSSEFKAGDAIGVSLNGETATYTYDGTAWTSEAPLYWKDKQPATITAWYPVEEEIDFTQQNVKGLTYLLKGKSNTDADYDTPANLTFAHQLAKVRVKLEGTKADEVTAVTVRSYPTSTHSHGTLDSQDRSLTPQYVPMREATYNDVKYWEANLRPGYLDANNSFQVANADGVRVQVTQDRVDIKAGHVHTVTIRVDEAQPVEGEISDDAYYLVSGTFEQQITITGGNPTIYLEGASINVSDGPAINITGGNPTIHVFGKNNTITSSNGAGIYVAEGYSVTIKGNNTDDELIVTGGNGGAGVGGYVMETDIFPYYDNKPCGNISISNVKLTASCNGNNVRAGFSAGIGAAGDSTVGSIDINNAIVTAIGQGSYSMGAAAIGGGQDASHGQTTFSITISDSEIHATKGSSYASYIGAGGHTVVPAGYNVIPTAKITNSTIYNESGTEITQ